VPRRPHPRARDAQTAFAAAAALPGPHGRDAVLLASIATAHDLADVAEVLDEWRARPDP
jgi:hypothetical protein